MPYLCLMPPPPTSLSPTLPGPFFFPSSSLHLRRRITTVGGTHIFRRSRLSEDHNTHLFTINPHNTLRTSSSPLFRLLPLLSPLSSSESQSPSLSSMSTAEMEPLTSGASNRIIPILKALRSALVFVHTFVVSILLLLLPRRRRGHAPPTLSDEPPPDKWKASPVWRRREVEDTLRRRTLAEGLDMGFETGDGDGRCQWSSSLFFGVRRNALFCRSWVPVSGEMK